MTNTKRSVIYLKAGDIVQVKGKRLAIDETDPAQGVYFSDESARPMRAREYVINYQEELIFKVPELPPGAYRLEVRNTQRSKNIKRGFLEDSLRVET